MSADEMTEAGGDRRRPYVWHNGGWVEVATLAAERDALRATVARVQALVAFYDRHGYATLNVDDLREIVADV